MSCTWEGNRDGIKPPAVTEDLAERMASVLAAPRDRAGFSKVAIRRDSSYPVGVPAPLHLVCPVDDLQVFLPPDAREVTCPSCGSVYSSTGWILSGPGERPMSPAPTVEELKHDPATPFWAVRLIADVEERDPVDVANVLQVLADAYGRRADAFLYRGCGR